MNAEENPPQMEASASPDEPGSPESAPRQTIGTSHKSGEHAEYAHRLSWGIQVWQRLKRDPALAVTLAYLVVAAIGVWSSYWYYRSFRIDILDYFQASDFIVAGLRDPMSFVFLGVMLLAALVSYAPSAYELRQPQKVEAWRKRWWGRVVFLEFASPFRRRRWHDISPEAAILLALALGGGSLLMIRAADRAAAIVANAGRPLQVTLAGSTRPLLGEARLIGTSSAYVFLYWPANGRAEALPQQALSRLEMLPRRTPRASVKGGVKGVRER